MNESTRQRLLDLNREFYATVSDEFSASRHAAWEGWRRLTPLWRSTFSRQDPGVLDVGCGNGRFLRYLLASPELGDHCADRAIRYTGLDAEPRLLEAAKSLVEGGRRLPTIGAGEHRSKFEPVEWILRDVLQIPLQQAEIGAFETVVAFGLMHHVPGQAQRLQLIRELASQLRPGGVMVLTSWRIALDERALARQISCASWSADSGSTLDPGELEPGDYLLTFGPRRIPRFCHESPWTEQEDWVEASGLRLETRLAASPEARRPASGDHNDYLVLRNAGSEGSVSATTEDG